MPMAIERRFSFRTSEQAGCMVQPRVLLAYAMMALGMTAMPTIASAAVWSFEATVSNERTTDIVSNKGSNDVASSGGVSRQSTETFEQSYILKYEQSITPTVDFSGELDLDLTDEIVEGSGKGDYDSQSIGTSVDASLTSSKWWDASVTWERDRDSSEDPGSPTTAEPSWSGELNIEPESAAAPAFAADFTKDQSIEDGKLLTTSTDLNVNLDYDLWDLLTVSLAYTREMEREADGYTFEVYDNPTDKNVIAEFMKDKINHGDGSTRNYFLEDYLLSTDVSMDLELLEDAKLEISWTNEIDPDVTYPDSEQYRDLAASKVFNRNNEIQAKLSYTLLENIEISVDRTMSWDYEWHEVGELAAEKEPRPNPPGDRILDANSKWDSEISFDNSLTDTLDIELSYTDSREDDKPDHDGPTYSIGRDYSGSLDFTPLANITFSTSFDRSDEVAWVNTKGWRFTDSAEQKTESVDDSWESSLEASFWEERIGFSASHSRGTTKEQGSLTVEEKSWEFELPLNFEDIPNLSVKPSYSMTRDQDMLEASLDVTREYKMDIKYELMLGDVVTFTLDHSYSRNVDLPDEGQHIIDRADDTEFSVELKDFFHGMVLDGSLTRTASDQNKDDKGPEVDYTYEATFDWDFLEQYSFSFEYSHDKQQESDDSRSMTTTLSMEFLDGLLTVDIEHNFEEQLEGDTKDSHDYSIEVSGQF